MLACHRFRQIKLVSQKVLKAGQQGQKIRKRTLVDQNQQKVHESPTKLGTSTRHQNLNLSRMKGMIGIQRGKTGLYSLHAKSTK